MTITEQEIRKRLGDHLGRASDALSTFLANEQNTSTVTKSSAKKGKGSNKKRSRSELLKDSNIVESADSSCAALNLFEKLQSVHLIITFNRPPEDRLEPTICVLPHSPLKVGSDESPSAFLLVKYPQRKAKDIVASSDKLRSIIKKVSDEDKFRKKFATHELRRRLCHSFQLLLVDKRIVPAYIPLMFGKAALSHNRIPIAISVHESIPNLERDLEAACRSAVIVFRGQRTLNVCLGYTSVLTSGSFIAQNALCILKEILNAENLLQRGWMDIESIALEDASSRARLLVYAHDYSEEREWMKNNMSELDEILETVLVQKNSQPSSDSNEFEDDSDLDCDDGKVDVPQMSSPKSSQSARQNKKEKVVGKTEKIEMNSKGSPKSPKKGMNSTSSSSVIHSRVKKVK